MVASGFAYLQKLQEESFATYQKMSEAGVNFGSDINNIRIQASSMGLSLEQMSALVTKNSEALSMMGGGTDKAMKAFQLASSQMINSESGDHLRTLGYTTEQVNQGMMNYIKFTGGRTSKEMENTSELIGSSTQYMETLDGLARVTGMTRDQQQAALDEASKNAAWQAKLATMTTEQKDKAIDGMARALALGGKGAVDAFQSKIMGVAPDKAGQMFITLASKTSGVVDKIANNVFDSSKNISDNTKLTVQGIRASQADIAKYGSQGAYAISRAGGDVGNALQALGVSANRAGKFTDEQLRESLNASSKQADDKKKGAAEEVENQKAMQKTRDELIEALNDIRIEFGPLMHDVGKWLLESMVSIKDWSGEIKAMAIAAGIAWVALKAFEGYKAVSGLGTILRGGAAAGTAATVAGGGAAAAAGGAGVAASIVEIGTAISAVGRMGHWVLLGAAAIGGAITLVGAGIAGAIWLTGKALPTFSDGIMTFTRIEGGKLVDVAKGIAALGAAMAVFGVTSPLAGAGNIIGSIFSGIAGIWKGDIISKVEDSVNRLTPVIPRLAILGPAMQAFGQGMMAYGQAINTIDIGKADKVADLMKKPAVAAEIDSLAKNALTINATSREGTTDQKDFRQLVVQLNTNMAALARYMSDTADNTRRTVNEIHGLSGNLYPRP
jgi:hypothetical protein